MQPLSAKDYRYLIHLVRCAVKNEQPRELPQGVSFESVFRCAQEHDVANLAFYAIEKLDHPPAEPLYSEWQQRFFEDLVRDAAQTDAYRKITEAFRKAQIRYIEVQGTRYKPFYPQPDYRTMGDLDFIVESQRLPQAWELLRQLGFRKIHFNKYDAACSHPDGVLVEVHTGFFPGNSHPEYQDHLGDAFDRVVSEWECSCEVDDTTFYLYGIFHYLKHYLSYGCGIRRILDLYYLERNYADRIDRKRTEQAFRALGVSDLVRDSFRVAESWFGNAAPSGELAEIEKTVCLSGLYGKLSLGLSRTFADAEPEQLTTAKRHYLLHRMLLDKETIYNAYPICEKLHLPLTLSRLYRFGHILFAKNHLKKTLHHLKTLRNVKPLKK